MTRRLLFFLAAFALLLPLPLDGRDGSVVKCADNTFLFDTDHQAKVLLRFCSPSIVRVEYAFDGEYLLDWRDDSMNQAKPSTHENLDITIRSSRDVKRVWAASPDVNGGAPQELAFSASGISIKCTVPSLTYWTMIVIE